MFTMKSKTLRSSSERKHMLSQWFEGIVVLMVIGIVCFLILFAIMYFGGQ